MGERRGSGSKLNMEGEQMRPHLEMTDSSFLCHNERKKGRLHGAHFIEFAAGSTRHAQAHAFWVDIEILVHSRLWLCCCVCKVEKNLRKTKVYEWLNSPVACSPACSRVQPRGK